MITSESIVVRVAVMMLTMTTMIPRMHAVEYCHNQVFTASCDVGSVIAIESAFYGRLRLGSCVKTDFGYIGCYRDVTMLARMRCSDRRKCQMQVPDVTFDRLSPCNKDLKNYLDIEYSCLPVATPVGPCNNTRSLPLTSSEGWISSLVTAETRCGTKDSPWVIEALPGQRIQLTVNDLSGVCSNSSGEKAGCRPTSAGRPCIKFAVLTEPALDRTFVVCSTGRRSYQVYMSIGHMLHIALVASNEHRFLFQYEVIGCPTVVPPRNGWVRRDESTLTFGCTATGSTWQLTCVGREWRGLAYNCSEAGSHPQGSKKSISTEVGIAVILIVSATTALLILAVGILYVRRRTRDAQSRDVTTQPFYADANYPPRQCYTANATFRCTKRQCDSASGTEVPGTIEKCIYACEIDVDPRTGSRPKCNVPLRNTSPKSRPLQESRVRYKVIGYPGPMNTFKSPRPINSDTDASRVVHGFPACRYARCRSRDGGDADDEAVDAKGNLLSEK